MTSGCRDPILTALCTLPLSEFLRTPASGKDRLCLTCAVSLEHLDGHVPWSIWADRQDYSLLSGRKVGVSDFPTDTLGTGGQWG